MRDAEAWAADGDLEGTPVAAEMAFDRVGSSDVGVDVGQWLRINILHVNVSFGILTGAAEIFAVLVLK